MKCNSLDIKKYRTKQESKLWVIGSLYAFSLLIFVTCASLPVKGWGTFLGMFATGIIMAVCLCVFMMIVTGLIIQLRTQDGLSKPVINKGVKNGKH